MDDIANGAKVLSIGVYAKEHKAQSPNKEKMVQQANRTAYRNQLEHDMALKEKAKARAKEANDVHPFDRTDGRTILRDRHNEHVQEEALGGYQIGRDVPKDQRDRNRKDAQSRYLQQLEQDMRIKAEMREQEENSPSKKVIKRRPASPEVAGEFAIGVRSTLQGEQKKEKARQFFQQNQEDIDRRQMMRTQRSTEVDIDGQFAIGADETLKKEAKLAATREYMEALNKDLGDRSSTRKVNEDSEYVNHTGWSGLDIGGASSGNTSSVVALRTQKEKQRAYKEQLDSQMHASEERSREQKRREDDALANTAAPPYLEPDRHA